jgi:subtilase family serine protease
MIEGSRVKPFYGRFGVVLCFPALLLAQEDRIAGPIEGARTVVKGNVNPKSQPQFDQGPVDPSLRPGLVTLALKPSPEQQAALQQLLDEQQDPSSPNYHHWLTPEQYADGFGLSSGDIAKIREWLESQGFAIGHVARSRNWVAFSGTAAQITNAFHTEIHRYLVDGEIHFANATEPAIPAALEPVVLGVLGLDDFHPKPPRASLGPKLAAGGENYLAPDDIATIYDITRLYQAGIDGSGIKIAIAGTSDIALADIAVFQAGFGLPANVPTVMLAAGSIDPGTTPAEVEADLDIEWAGAVARNAQITYVISGSVLESAAYAISESLAPVLSFSFGGCETGFSPTSRNSIASIAGQANAQGITWVASSGDSGAAACDKAFDRPEASLGLAVSFPASLAELTAVGGAEFDEGTGNYWSSTNSSTGESALSYIPETAWNESGPNGLAASGGGFSEVYPQPSWQIGPGLPAVSGRAVPDVALAASFHDGHVVISGGQMLIVFGTSAAAPVFAGMVALLNQHEGSSGLGNINSNLYRLAQTKIFHDITTGSNVVPCEAGMGCINGALGYFAAPGYDPVTGLGSVDAYNLVKEWNAASPASKIVPACTPDPVYEQQPDAQGDGWFYTISLTETAGVATELTGFTFGGVDYSSQIASYFGSSTITANGTISVNLEAKSLTVPATVVFGFTGVDAGGRQWSQQLSVPFNGLQQSPTPSPTIAAVVNAGSYQSGISAGEIATLFGANLSSVVGIASAGGATSYEGVSVTVGGRLAPLFAVANVNGQEQINFQVPVDLPSSDVTEPVQVNNNGSIGTMTVAIAPAQPGFSNTRRRGVPPSMP